MSANVNKAAPAEHASAIPDHCDCVNCRRRRGNRHVRWMLRADLPEVLDIEQLAFPRPWDEADFVSVLRQRNMIGMVATSDAARPEWIDGFMIYELLPTRLEITNFAVHPSCWRRGVGRAMVDKLIGKLSWERRRALTLSISEGNLAGQLFWKAMGFRARPNSEINHAGGYRFYRMEYELRG